MGKLINKLTWSASRNGTLQGCARKYFYQYYLSWGGWESNCDPRVRLTYVLKNLKSRQMWAGTKVHEAVEHCLKNLMRGISILPAEQVINITLEDMRREYAGSLKKNYVQKPKQLGLVEHHYKQEITNEQWKENAENVRKSLTNFYKSELFKLLSTMPIENFVEIENLTTFNFDGTDIWVSLDLCYKEDDKIIIVDWKTGRPSDKPAPMQLATYALYAQDKWSCPPENLRLKEINLPHQIAHEFTFSQQETENTRALIKGCIADTQAMCKDIANNVPKDEEEFPLAENESACRFCNFKEICPRFADSP
jgi:CRISPR/Cas system-associated exonuclease Cas4 (RecB family)